MNVGLLVDELERDEALRLKPYQDSMGYLTIGVGRNLSTKGISRKEAICLLRNDIADALDQLDKHLPWWRGIDEVRQRVLANMCFNLGIERLLGFQKMLAALQKRDYEGAAEEMASSAWDREVGNRAARLIEAIRSGVMTEAA